MFQLKDKNFMSRFKSDKVQKIAVLVVAFLLTYLIVLTSAGTPQQKTKSEEPGQKADIKVSQFVSFISSVKGSDEGLDKALLAEERLDGFFTVLLRARDFYKNGPEGREFAVREFMDNVYKQGFFISKEEALALVAYPNYQDVYNFKEATDEILRNMIKQQSNTENLSEILSGASNEYQGKFIPDSMKRTGINVLQVLSKDLSGENQIISTGFRKKLGFLGLTLLLTMILTLMVIYVKTCAKGLLLSKQKVIMLCVAFVLTLLIGKWVLAFSTVAIPVFIAAVLVSILLDPILGIVVNLTITLVISLVIPVDNGYMMMSLLSGTFASFLSAKANKKNRLFLAGIVIGAVNVLIVGSLGLMSKSSFSDIAIHALIAFLNGTGSVVIAIGLMPFFENLFNIVTPVKLLEIINPNQPLIKRLLLEAPGTYHHSLMVGNLAEAAAESIGANALLARAGALYHDVGKLIRPDFFMENQMMENPHERLTPNLSTLVITSHTNDGYELALKHRIPTAVRDIIREHHGTTLVAYFYNKAKNGEKGDTVTEENFRYSGPKPSTVESAVVMLADSVEAAVRALSQKTEGKIEGLIRKIIKGKLEDGQLAQCNLTLKELEVIADSFIKVFGGYFHEREEYPLGKGVASLSGGNVSVYPDNLEQEAEAQAQEQVSKVGPTDVEIKAINEKESEGEKLANTG